MQRIVATLALTAALVPSSASACGGFFCSQTEVEQNAERIVFAIDKESGKVETHVQIFYQGEAPDFAWVVPVPGEPELFLSTDTLFDTLSMATQPTFWMDVHEKGECGGWSSTVTSASSSWDGSYADTGLAAGGGYDVLVVSEQKVGPYETVVLKARDASELVSWLQANDYDVEDDMDAVLAPYVSSGAHFVALRLSNDKDAGDIAPLGMRYEGSKPMIPIQLTAIAATPDMRLETYVFSDGRAVPDNYLHVQINEAAIDWFTYGGNYEDVITGAANEAGGQAFATDFAGSPSFMRGTIFVEGRYDPASLAVYSDFADFMGGVMSQRGVIHDPVKTMIKVGVA
jgi:hypothetical protein